MSEVAVISKITGKAVRKYMTKDRKRIQELEEQVEFLKNHNEKQMKYNSFQEDQKLKILKKLDDAEFLLENLKEQMQHKTVMNKVMECKQCGAKLDFVVYRAEYKVTRRAHCDKCGYDEHFVRDNGTKKLMPSEDMLIVDAILLEQKNT